MGDSICAMPAIELIKANYPNAKIDILTNAGGNNLVSIGNLISNSTVNQIIDYSDKNVKAWSKLIRESNYDLYVELPQYTMPFSSCIRNMLFCRFYLRIKAGFGWQYTDIKFFRKTQEKFRKFPNEKDRLVQILIKNGLILKDYPLYNFNVSKENHKKVENLIQESNWNSEKTTIGLVVGAKRPQNQWPISHFNSVIQHFGDRLNWFAFGSQEDSEKIESLQAHSLIFNFCGKLKPLETGLMMQKCDLVLSNDTGPMHLAYAMNVPLISLFSSRDYPNKWYPPSNNANEVFRTEDIECSVCFSSVCADNICMKRITPEKIIQAIDIKIDSIEDKTR
ncbi:MAG: glycosyltransferase family 9 protein [Bacteroidetes bacterium]|nr:glycosyltransferase family 9 protein [Bacteroidota bacterium]